MGAGRDGLASGAATRAAGSGGFGTLASHVPPRAWGLSAPRRRRRVGGKRARIRGRETTPARPLRAALFAETARAFALFRIGCAPEISLGLVYFLKNFAKFLDSPSHRIFRRMHRVLNIDENKN